MVLRSSGTRTSPSSRRSTEGRPEQADERYHARSQERQGERWVGAPDRYLEIGIVRARAEGEDQEVTPVDKDSRRRRGVPPNVYHPQGRVPSRAGRVSEVAGQVRSEPTVRAVSDLKSGPVGHRVRIGDEGQVDRSQCIGQVEEDLGVRAREFLLGDQRVGREDPQKPSKNEQGQPEH